MLRIAGFPFEFSWSNTASRNGNWDIYYGPDARLVKAGICIPAGTWPFESVWRMDPVGLDDRDGLVMLDFGEPAGEDSSTEKNVLLPRDIVFSAYWLLAGSQEPRLSRDRMDNLNSLESDLVRLGLMAKPLVSEYGDWLGRRLEKILASPRQIWSGCEGGIFALSHDVDYPEIIRAIECLRLLKDKGWRGISKSIAVLHGRSHFWHFLNWVDFADELRLQNTFFFMARQGSLLQYALGTPDAFYDIGSRRFQELFSELKDRGAEIGLHASFHAHRSVDTLSQEKLRLEKSAGVPVSGNRHHYWHLDPDAPHATLSKLEAAGFTYDSSLLFEISPGFRRSICHPFFPYDPVRRRALDIVELPPAWMDDHFHGRRPANGIEDPAAFARTLLGAASSTSGLALVDYHVRGMNADFFPEFGPWLMRFLRNHLDGSMSRRSPGQIAETFLVYNREYLQASSDMAD